MKKYSLTLIAFGFCLVFISAIHAATTPASPESSFTVATTSTNSTTSRPTNPSTFGLTDEVGSSETTSKPNDPNARSDAGENVRPDGPGITRHFRQPAETSKAISDDPDVRKNEADFRAAKEKCDAIVDADLIRKCMNEAETNYIKGKP